MYCLDCGRDHDAKPYPKPDEITDEKREAYRRGEYRTPPPPVITQMWNEDAWIRWIDVHGSWT